MSLEVKKWCPVKDHPDKALILSHARDHVRSLVSGAQAKGWSTGAVDKLVSYAEKACEGEGDHDLTVLGDCLIFMSQIIPVWWLDTDALVEFAIFRYKPGDINEAWEGLDQFAKYCNCRQIVISSSASVSDRAFSRVLQRAGFVPGSINFTRSIQ